MNSNTLSALSVRSLHSLLRDFGLISRDQIKSKCRQGSSSILFTHFFAQPASQKLCYVFYLRTSALVLPLNPLQFHVKRISTIPSMSRSGVNEYSTKAELIKFCVSPPQECILGGAPYGNKVVQISGQAVIKFGVGVREAEAVNQSKAYELVDPQVVRIPKVHRYFSDNEDRGYIVMEFVEGDVIEPLEDPIRISTVAGILDHLASFRRIVPDPLNYGPPCGLLFFPDEEEVPFTDVKDLERWWNCRIFPGESAINLQGLDPVLCHLDVAPRNILWRDGEAPCLVDWASAGYYPRVFESCAQLIVERKDGRFNRLLLDAMPKLECRESEQIAPVLQAWSNMQKYQL